MVNFGDFSDNSALFGGFNVVTVLTDMGLNIKTSRKQVNWYISWQGLILKRWWKNFIHILYRLYRNCVIYQLYVVYPGTLDPKDMSDMWSPGRFAWSHPILKKALARSEWIGKSFGKIAEAEKSEIFLPEQHFFWYRNGGLLDMFFVEYGWFYRTRTGENRSWYILDHWDQFVILQNWCRFVAN